MFALSPLGFVPRHTIAGNGERCPGSHDVSREYQQEHQLTEDELWARIAD